MDIRSIIDSDSAPAKPASRQRSDAKLGYQQTQPSLHSPYEVQSSAHKGPREKRPPQPPPLQPPVHNDTHAPGASSHNSVQSPYQQTPSTGRSSGQYLYPHHPIQSPIHGFQPLPYAKRESHLASTGPTYQPHSQPASISPTPTVTTPVIPHAYSHQSRQSSSQSLPTPTSAQSQLPNMFNESPQASHPQIHTSSQSHSSQQYLSQPGTPLGPPSMYGRPPLLNRESSGSYEHQRNHSVGSYSHQQAMASSPRKDALGSSAVSPSSGPRQFLSHSQTYQTKHEREQSLSVSPKTRLPGELTLYQPNEELGAKLKKYSSLSSASPKENNEPYLPQGQTAIQSLSRSRSLGVKGILNTPSVNNGTSGSESPHSLTRSSLAGTSDQEFKLIPTTTVRSESLILPSLGTSSIPHLNKEPPLQQFSPHQPSSQTHGPPNWQPQPIPKSLLKLQTPPITLPPKPAQPPMISYPATAIQTTPLSFPPTTVQTPTASFPSAAVQTNPVSFPPPPPPPHPPYAAAAAIATPQTTPLSLSPSTTAVRTSPVSFHPHPPSAAAVRTPPVSFPPPPPPPPPPPLPTAAAAAATKTPPELLPPPVAAAVQTPPVSFPSIAVQTNTQSSVPADTMVHQSPTKQQRKSPPSPGVRRRRRNDPPPVWALSARQFPKRFASDHPSQSSKQYPATKLIKQGAQGTSAEPAPSASIPATPRNVRQEANGLAAPSVENPVPRIHQAITDHSLLGPWETNILNTIPSEETIKVISDFLYTEVVGRADVGSGPAGGGSSKGAVLEIEAKIGQLIDKNTNDRLRLPTMTECVLDKQDPNLRVAFKSSMTEAQHRSLNGFLNKALVNSQPPKGPPPIPPSSRPRIPMSYVHTYESDTFYELSQSGSLSLPGSIRSLLNPRNNKAKVRVTTDQKTGKELAKIVKVRIADLDVYSPRTAFDWRISINLEMNFDGDMKDLVEPLARNGRRPDRNKDRMSYKHLVYQIDLTQVTTAEATSKTDKEHELEIEISSDDLRKHGVLLKDGYPNEFQKLVEGFVYNVRVLARHCQ